MGPEEKPVCVKPHQGSLVLNMLLDYCDMIAELPLRAPRVQCSSIFKNILFFLKKWPREGKMAAVLVR